MQPDKHSSRQKQTHLHDAAYEALPALGSAIAAGVGAAAAAWQVSDVMCGAAVVSNSSVWQSSASAMHRNITQHTLSQRLHALVLACTPAS